LYGQVTRLASDSKLLVKAGETRGLVMDWSLRRYTSGWQSSRSS
jgi:hypothetical protein